MNVAQWLLQADKTLFYLINKELSSPELDNFMLLVRQPFAWIPLYFFFLLFFSANCRRHLLPIVALSLLTFSISDFTSASILKPLIGRLRPCHDPTMMFSINNISGCGGLFSMPSSHASNHFGLAGFWFLIIKRILNQNWYWLWLWAFLVGFSQIYVGVHFPGDIIAGALLGIAVAYFTSYLFFMWTTRINPALINKEL